MNRTRLLPLLASAFAGIALLAPAVPANAAADTVSDKTRDAELYRPPTGAVQAAPKAARADITSFRTVHTADAVVARVKVRNLELGVQDSELRIRTDKGDYTATYAIYRSQGRWRRTIQLGQDYEVRCRGLKATHSYARDTIKITVPRSCLKNPKWVRTGWLQTQQAKVGQRYYIDDARRTAGAKVGTSRLGPRITPA